MKRDPLQSATAKNPVDLGPWTDASAVRTSLIQIRLLLLLLLLLLLSLLLWFIDNTVWTECGIGALGFGDPWFWRAITISS